MAEPIGTKAQKFIDRMNAHAGEMATLMSEAVGEKPPKLVQMFVYEFNRRMEEAMLRVTNVAAFINAHSEEFMTAVAETKLADQKVLKFPEAKGDGEAKAGD